MAQSGGDSRIPSHIEFISQWFPKEANSAIHMDVERSTKLATRMDGSPTRFSVSLTSLDLIRNSVGFDSSQIEKFTRATITRGVPGTVLFFTLKERVPIEEHFATGQHPVAPKVDKFHSHKIYQLPLDGHTLGLYTAEGKHFILGDWEPFKTTLLGNDGDLNELAKILSHHSGAIIICSNPRRQARRAQRDAPFGTVISIDYDQDTLGLLMQEEHSTPDRASERHAVMEKELPKTFEKAYGLPTKKGVRYLANADGRHARFGVQAPIRHTEALLKHLLGAAVPADRHAKSIQHAETTIQLYQAAQSAGVLVKPLSTPEAVIAALCAGLEGGGKRFQLPFLTGVEQEQIAERLLLESGTLALAPEPGSVVPDADEVQIRRHARLIATLTMSAAAADSPELKKLKTTDEIVATLCSTGLTGGGVYRSEKFLGPELSPGDVERVSEFLTPSEGYLVYRSE